MDLRGRHFINLEDFKSEELLYLIDLAEKLKKNPEQLLNGKTLAMYFSKPSLRTRLSFEVGMHQLGGTSYVIKRDEIDLGVRESIEDVARVISRYTDGITIRTFAHKDVEVFAKNASIPVVNALTDFSHPCQIMADLLTIKEQFGKLEGLKLAYLGDGNNVANTLLTGCAMVGMNVSVATPKGYEPDENIVKFAKNQGVKVTITTSPQEAVEEANILYTDVWASMGQESEAEARKVIFAPYQINSDLLKNTSKDKIILHCLPAHKGLEITEEVFEQYAKVIFDEAENRMHAQKAILASIM